MTEPTSSAAAAGLGLLAKFAPGVGGALIMAAFDPPPDRRTLFLQASTAGVGSLLFGGPAVKILDYFADFVDLAKLSEMDRLEWAVPVYFLVGALSWGAFGALARFRQIIRERGGDVVADKVAPKP
jgi:hypothetical protein